MILESCRLLTDWLNDPSNGVAAMLATTPRDAGDPLPTLGTIADETRNDLVAQQRLPSLPGVGVNVEIVNELDGEVATYTRDGRPTLLIRYGVAKDATSTGVRDAAYVLRAIIKSIRLFNASTRTRNQVDIYSCLQLSYTPMWRPIEDAIITGAVRVQFQARDNAP